MSNPCTNCGKERIDDKTWIDKTGLFAVTYTQTVCPDPDCQKVVDKITADRKEKADKLAKNKLRNKSSEKPVIPA